MSTIPMIYTTANCPDCEKTKQRFIEKGVKFTEVSLDERPDEVQRLKDAGYDSAPVIASNKGTWMGYRPDLIDSLVGYQFPQRPHHRWCLLARDL